ncbi:MAG TPA: hypothetical protein VK870_07100 [Ignavibacteriaceae bacterium]|nr:hypothetical protein [Ignavibacteriaceae bacterium]
MSQFLRILLLIVVFIFLYRIIKRFLIGLFGRTNNTENKSPFNRQNKKYDNIEEAKYTEISDVEEKEKNS